MAGLKKKKREKGSSPNIVLVVFLVLFVLTSIGLGGWGYSLVGEQAALRADKKAAVDKAKVQSITADYYAMQAMDDRMAIFGPDALTPDEKAALDGQRAGFYQPDYGPFKLEKNKETVRKTMDELKQRLGAAANNDYEKNFKAELEAANAKIKEIEGKTNAEIAKHEKTKELLASLQKDNEKLYLAMKDKINKDALAQQAKIEQRSDEFTKLAEANRDLNAKIAEDAAKANEKMEEYDKVIKNKDLRIAKMLEDAKRDGILNAGGPGGAAAANPSRGDFFPLLLDVSPGKPLWDQPVGKVTRVDLELRQAIINVGEAHGTKPELTFNVFGANAAGKAEKQLKGTLEITKVIDSSSSQCRITSLYDSEGNEIALNLKSRGQTLRETEAPMKEGDLLFNLFWGTRVAVTGYVGITGDKVDNPADQFRQMDDFMALCRRNGMIVDAYVDLRSGQIQGKITSRTRYLIRGDDLTRPASKEKAPAMKKDDDEGEKKEEPAAKDAGAGDRIDLVNRASAMLRNDARDKGLLLISAENFANVIGYRKIRSANSLELSGFRPTLPYAGAPRSGGVMGQAERPMEKREEPPAKDMEKKKDDN